MVMVCGTWIVAIVLRLSCQWGNRQHDLGKRDHVLEGVTAIPAERHDQLAVFSHP